LPKRSSNERGCRADGLDLIGLSEDRPGDHNDVVRAAAMAGDARKNGFAKPKVLPITYVIDATGIVRLVLSPDKTAITEQSLNESVSPELSK